MATYQDILAKCKELYAKQHPGALRGPGIKTCHIAHAKELLGVPKNPVPQRALVNTPAPRKSCRSSVRPSSHWACCRRKSSKLRPHPFPLLQQRGGVFPTHARAVGRQRQPQGVAADRAAGGHKGTAGRAPRQTA